MPPLPPVATPESIPIVPHPLVRELLASHIVHQDDWEALSSTDRLAFADLDRVAAIEAMVKHGLLTPFMAERVGSGATHGLILGNYRVLDRIGAGGMAVVYKAEHLEMRHSVAVKVRPQYPEQDARLTLRFSNEMRIVARLRHPNIVAALDAGRVVPPDPQQPTLWYIVMEYVPGRNLEELIKEWGPLPIPLVSSMLYQISSALGEMQRFHLVHRDIKPSNIMMTPEEQAKLLDFGLSRQRDDRLTLPGAVLGTVDYMAPEQGRDASAVDIRADIYSLGVTTYFCLTGKLPFPPRRIGMVEVGGDKERRLQQHADAIREARPDCPPGLELIVARMMAIDPTDRFQSSGELLQALLPLIQAPKQELRFLPTPETLPEIDLLQRSLPERLETELTPSAKTALGVTRALIVDDDDTIRELCRLILTGNGVICDAAANGEMAVAMGREPYDLVLLDVVLPGISGRDVLRHLREHPPTPHVKIIMLSGTATPDEANQLLLAGADDFVAKPFGVAHLDARIKTALRLKDAQDQVYSLNRHLLKLNDELERSLALRDGEVRRARNALVRLLTQLVYRRYSPDGDIPGRMQRLTRCLSEAAARVSAFSTHLTPPMIETLVGCAPLYDVGKALLPDHILHKPGKLTAEEFLLMQTHTTMGAELTEAAARDNPVDSEFFRMAVHVIRHHHERYDGTGYPDKLVGAAIPISARVVSICNVYLALRTRQPFRPALNHATATQLMVETFAGHFDPQLLEVFKQIMPEFDRILG